MNRIVKYDILRVVACFAIVMLHVSNGYWYVVNVDSGDFTVMTIYNTFTRYAVPSMHQPIKNNTLKGIKE